MLKVYNPITPSRGFESQYIYVERISCYISECFQLYSSILCALYFALFSHRTSNGTFIMFLVQLADTHSLMQNHHVRDVIWSIPIGVICGFLAYRAHYASAFSYPTNHIPLSYTHPKKPFGLPFFRRSTSQDTSTKSPNGRFLAVKWPRGNEEEVPRGLGDQDRELMKRSGNVRKTVSDSGQMRLRADEMV